jgi:HAD superfamily phosphatase
MVKPVLVFDMDGVLVEVTESYRETIVRTVERFTGKKIARELIQEYKNQGGWNNDWALSQKIAHDLGVDVPYDVVVTEFNKIFFGNGTDGLMRRERWIPAPGLLESLSERYRLAIFTGRDRYETDLTLERSAMDLHFDPIVCSGDVVNGKPAPDGLWKIAAAAPGAELIYVGDTVDDARSATAARVPFIGIAAPASSHRDALIALMQAENAIAILDDINQLESALEAVKS